MKWLLPVAVALAAAACSEADAPVELDEKTPGTMTLEIDGRSYEFDLSAMEIYLVEEPEEHAETYEISGDGVMLAGSFPMDLHVGYGDRFERMTGKRIPVFKTGGDRADEKTSSVTLPDGKTYAVTSGSLTVERVSRGTISGKVLLELSGDAPGRAEGKFVVYAKTWG